MTMIKGGGKGSPGLSTAMKNVGRGMAKANQQASSKKTPMGFSSGGAVKGEPKNAGGNTGGTADSFGGGTVRGGKAQTSGKKWQGAF